MKSPLESFRLANIVIEDTDPNDTATLADLAKQLARAVRTEHQTRDKQRNIVAAETTISRA